MTKDVMSEAEFIVIIRQSWLDYNENYVRMTLEMTLRLSGDFDKSGLNDEVNRLMELARPTDVELAAKELKDL